MNFKNKGINVLSLFDGISCARVALDKAGIKINKYYSSEIDQFAKIIAQKNYPNTIQLGDVKTISKYTVRTISKYTPERYGDADIDLLIGGFPCTNLSIAKNNREGLKGKESGLFYEMVRIHKEIKPRWFIYENVKSMSKEAKQIITETLGVESICIDASLVSAQQRKRLFWTNIERVKQPEDRHIYLKDIIENGEALKEKAYCLTANQNDFVKRKQGNYVFTGGAKRTREGKGKQLEIRKDGKANALTSVQTDSMVVLKNYVRPLTPIECERLHGLPDRYSEGLSKTQRKKVLGNAFNVDVVSWILSFIIN